jgi:hypothetical protein
MKAHRERIFLIGILILLIIAQKKVFLLKLIFIHVHMNTVLRYRLTPVSRGSFYLNKIYF